MSLVCNPVELTCDVCYTLALPYNNMIVDGGLTPSSTPYLWITDKFGNQYKDQIVIASDGSFTINPDNYPEGMFNPSAGSFDLFLSSDSAGATIVPMTFYAIAYYPVYFNCVKISITC